MGFLLVLSAIVAAIAVGIYFFGIPPEVKRKLEHHALNAMGENKLSYVTKDQISKIPTTDEAHVKQFKTGIGNALGGATQNPLGETAGNLGRVIIDRVQRNTNSITDTSPTVRKAARMSFERTNSAPNDITESPFGQYMDYGTMSKEH